MPEVLLANSTLTVTADDDIKIEAKMDLSALTLSTPGEKDLTELPVKSAETVLSSDDEGKVTDVQREEERLWTSEGKGPRPWKLYKADEVPDWLRERFILTGYRAYTTYVQNWRSIFRWHNETLNIHTHLIALIATAAAANALVMRLEPNADVWDRTVFSAYIAGAAFCFGASTLFHTHFPNSPEAFHTYCSLDTSGVSVLIMASTTIICYHFFYCQPVVRAVYIGLIIAANSVGILGPLWRAWTTPGFRSLRVAVFLGSAVLSCVPVFHYLIAYGFPPAGSWLLYAGLMVVFYLGGAFVYLMRFPERWSPGTFDYIGHSHTFWHCFIVAAAWSHYCCAIELHRWRVGGEYCAHP
ncbi:HlyIII-domain-containing protein [Gonapodya prolifera JEL478]|uniref:HlyIII-domain-containing protein n=1 Tax=Gonapodya prolifera (strain JEL478) TaxID=1344416 RepID=A0A139ASN1_GONPJ|nr:HlyIII-domain-containing protein [Gonapodya prolifera JEL478]|eukprot:KXS19752.1 HlyIII-domain-containing protein [Gonapodya prolifera JEL478]